MLTSVPDTPKSSIDSPILVEMRKRWVYATEQWREIREEASRDMDFLSGDGWDDKDRKAREDAGRPCLSNDQLNQFLNQLVNDIRQNKRAIKVTAQQSLADDQTADFSRNLIRQIEYRSNAQQAYTTMFENAAQRSYGFMRVASRYAREDSDEQELMEMPIPNPETVTIDPDIISPDGADMRYAWVRESRSIEEFKREFPDAMIQSFPADIAAQAPQWVEAERIYIAEYWDCVITKGKKGREKRKVTQYITNGVEILETHEWQGKSIPIISCFGKIMYVDGKRKIMSAPRLARDPQMYYNYCRTQQAELIGMIPKVPVIGYKGQFRGLETEWQKAPHEPLAFIEINAISTDTGQTILPLPSRLAYEPGAQLQAIELCAEGARRDIQSAMGFMPLPTQAQRQNEKSGVALQKIESTSQKGSFHFVDHYEASITRVGVILDELIPFYYDTARTVTVRKPDDTAEQVRINDPEDPTHPPLMISPEKWGHDVTISTGPSFDSQREEAANFAETLTQNEAIAPLIMDLVIRLRDLGPIGDQMAERLTPPQFKKPDQQQSPQQVQQQMMQLQQHAKQLEQAVIQLNDDIKTDKVKQQAMLEKAKLDASNQIELQIMKDATAIKVAEIQAAAKGAQVKQEADTEAIALNMQQQHDAQQSLQDRQHELMQSNLEHQQALQQADQAHQQGLQQSEVGHQQALEQGEQGQQHALEQQANEPDPTSAAE